MDVHRTETGLGIEPNAQPIGRARARRGSDRSASLFGIAFRTGSLLALASLLAALGCATGSGLSRDQAIAQVPAASTLAARLGAAQEEGLGLLAPRGVAAAEDSLEAAISRAKAGALEESQSLAEEGIARLDRAQADSRNAADALREVLERRRRAVAAGAPLLLPERFEELDEDLRDAARLAEAGELNDAKEARPALLRGYSSIELDALQTDATDVARKAIEEAREADADDYAPDTFARATRELGIARGILETDRSQVERANVHARRAAEFAARSHFLSELVKEFDRRDYDREAVLLWYQEQLEDLTSPLERGFSFDKPNHEAIAEVRERIAEAVQGRSAAETQLADARDRIEALEIASTVSRADLESRLEAIQQAQREAEARYARINSMFSEEEARVYRRGNDVLLETYGFDFPVGESEIRSSNFGLLNKIARAISEFDQPHVVVSGHTDATGNNETNERLSQERAQKVGAFLVEVGQLAPERVATEGYGEDRPVASNETSEGRARNRRIEILIVNSDDAAQGAAPEAVSASPPGS